MASLSEICAQIFDFPVQIVSKQVPGQVEVSSDHGKGQGRLGAGGGIRRNGPFAGHSGANGNVRFQICRTRPWNG